MEISNKAILKIHKAVFLLDTYKPHILEDLQEIKNSLNKMEFPKVYEKIRINPSKNINLIILNSNNIKNYKKNPLNLINKINKFSGWVLFIYGKDKKIIRQIQNQISLFEKFPFYSFIFGQTILKENSFGFKNTLSIPAGLLIRKELYDYVGGLSLKFFTLDISFFDLIKKLNEYFFMIDLTKCGFGERFLIKKENMNFEFERDFYSIILRNPFKAVFFDKQISKIK